MVNMSALAKLKETNAEATQWRQHIHANPETAFEEFKTSDYVANLLTSWGVEIHRGLAKTAVVGIIKGKSNKSGKAVGLRADMDALNILEENTVPYKSKNEGKMHACGHDGHTTMLLAATKYLAETRNFDGTVYAIFQPAEEFGGGGNVMVQEGFFKKFPCEAVFGMHNWPWLAAGAMSICEGPMSAFCDDFVLKVTGKGGHAAFPHTTIDVVATAAAIVTSLQSLVSRNVNPSDSAVVSVCKFHAGTDSLNVLPESVVLGGTARCFKPEIRKQLEDGIRRITKSICEAYGATAEVEWRDGYPSVVNTPKETQLCWDVATQVVGKDNVSKFTPMMGGEDFAYFLQSCPGAYIAIGGLPKGGEGIGLHNPRYNFNDEIIPVGAAYWVKLAETALPHS
jgi:hippurate hydrolase